MTRRNCLVAFVAMFSLTTFAQSAVQVITSLVKPGHPIPQECKAQVETFRSIEALYPHPNTWRWVVVCDDDSWRMFLTQAHLQAKLLTPGGAAEYGETDIDHGVTFLRGTILSKFGTLLSISNEPVITAEHLVTHELAHIVLRSRDEAKVDAQAMRWMKDRKDRIALAESQTRNTAR